MSVHTERLGSSPIFWIFYKLRDWFWCTLDILISFQNLVLGVQSNTEYTNSYIKLMWNFNFNNVEHQFCRSLRHGGEGKNNNLNSTCSGRFHVYVWNVIANMIFPLWSWPPSLRTTIYWLGAHTYCMHTY